MSTPSSRVRTLVFALPALLVAAGCSVIAGVDFGNAHERLDPAPGEEGGPALDDDGGGVAERPDATPTGCAPDQKTCAGACVSKNDPAYGCSATDCLPCSVAFAKNATCKAGQCAADTCATDHGDCDGDPKNGCEASLSSPLSCGKCGTKCAATAPLCAPTGCVSSCPGTLTECNGACVDTKTNLDNCGGCGTRCASPANGDPVCLNSTCTFACRTGFGDCVNNPAKACAPLPKWYADNDNDGVGGAASVQACGAPAGHVAASGDCLDSNPQVHPGQTAFFGTSFINGAGAVSYDYDCSGVEVDQADRWPGSCSADCTESGSTPKLPARAGAGVNTYCGSTTYRTCIDYGSSGGPIPVRAASISSPAPIAQGCQARASTVPAVGCR
ncbi:MAG TPA: hypothetical protein VLT33_35260 [Labilithrix sp.]|nr:hypothetical protein [Labilithrix sp.]